MKFLFMIGEHEYIRNDKQKIKEKEKNFQQKDKKR